MNRNTLVIAGSGIKFMSHITYETRNCIEKADKVLYLINEPALQEWIQGLNKNTESLDQIYTKYCARNDNYQAISEYIVNQLDNINFLCAVFYGHPTVLVQPAIYTAQAAETKGHNVIVMPGISAEDCLFADLLIDPSSCGCYSFEATDFLLYQREYESSSHLIIWQSGVIGIKNLVVKHNPEKGLGLFIRHLSKKYSLDHDVYIYEAAQYPTIKPRIEKTALRNLATANINRLTTLYIPPNCVKQINNDVCAELKVISEPDENNK